MVRSSFTSDKIPCVFQQWNLLIVNIAELLRSSASVQRLRVVWICDTEKADYLNKRRARRQVYSLKTFWCELFRATRSSYTRASAKILVLYFSLSFPKKNRLIKYTDMHLLIGVPGVMSLEHHCHRQTFRLSFYVFLSLNLFLFPTKNRFPNIAKIR